MIKVRSFLAISLTDTLQREVAKLQKELAPAVPEVRWTRPDNLHLTLRFFGDVPQEDLEKIKVSMLSVKRDVSAFAVAVKGLGAFPNLHRPRVIWLGLEPGQPLQSLFSCCQAALEQQGFTPEKRPFAPHLTIGRVRQQGGSLGRLAARYQDRQFGLLPVEALVLYESRLHRNGAEHIPLHTVVLAAEAGMEHNPGADNS